MTSKSQHEKDLWDLWRELDGIQSDLNCKLLPMIRLCLFASRAADVLGHIQQWAKISPEFKTALESATPFYNDPAASDAPEVLAGALWLAEKVAHELAERAGGAMEGDRS